MRKTNQRVIAWLSLIIGSGVLLTACDDHTEAAIEPPAKWQGHLQSIDLKKVPTIARTERIYVPVYSHIYSEDNERTLSLAGTLSVRNTDQKQPLILKSVAYYNTAGDKLQELCETPLVLPPLGTAEVVVPRSNTTGGSGANFIVEWLSEKPVSEPIAEAIMISAGSSRNISFVSRGTVIVEKKE